MNLLNYKVQFDTENFPQTITAASLTEAEAKSIQYMKENEINKCVIKTPTGKSYEIEKTGEHHWNHPGYTFRAKQYYY